MEPGTRGGSRRSLTNFRLISVRRVGSGLVKEGRRHDLWCDCLNHFYFCGYSVCEGELSFALTLVKKKR